MKIGARNVSLLLIALAAVTLGACRKQPAAGQQSTNKSATAPEQDAPIGGAAPSGEKFYFRGTIAGSLRIEMTLLRDREQLTGSYFYPKVGKNIELKGSIDKQGNVELKESDENGKETGIFKGKWKAATNSPDASLSDIEGKWSRPDGSKETAFTLSQQPIEFSGAIRLVPKLIREANKEAHYTIDAEYPQVEGDTRFDKFNREARSTVNGEVAKWKTSETASASESGPEAATETQDSSLSIRYDFRMARDDLISMEFYQGAYSRGAAHPNSFTTVLNYDVKSGKKLSLSDLFNPKSNYLNVISSYCIKDLKQQAQKTKDSMLSDESIGSGASARADNYKAWAITRKGLWITFDPYQVAPYAAGPQYVLVPYSALKDIIKPDGPIATFAK